jgi:TetR/AcrR family transcriptional regulator, cholesterol catabolism regulator
MASFPKPPTLNDDQRAHEIYRKAAVIFRTKGFDATSMGDIAEAVDLTKGGLYYYIKGKEAMLYAIMCFAAGRFEQQVIEPTLAIADAAERLRRMIALHIQLVISDPAPILVLFDESGGLNTPHRAAIKERKAEYKRIWQSVIKNVMAEAGVKDLEAAIVTEVILSLVDGVVRWYQPGVDREALVAQIQRMGLSAVRGTATSLPVVA